MNSETAGIRGTIPADLEAIDEACSELRRDLLADLSASDRFAIELLVREALTNAIFHGARGPRAGEIAYDVRPVPGGMSIRVADGGDGFDWNNWRETHSAPAEEYGLGMRILHRYASQVRFFGNGNEVELIRMLCKGTVL